MSLLYYFFSAREPLQEALRALLLWGQVGVENEPGVSGPAPDPGGLKSDDTITDRGVWPRKVTTLSGIAASRLEKRPLGASRVTALSRIVASGIEKLQQNHPKVTTLSCFSASGLQK